MRCSAAAGMLSCVLQAGLVGCASCSLSAPPWCRLPADADAAAAAGKVANGLLNGGYESIRFKTKPSKPTLEKGAAGRGHPWGHTAISPGPACLRTCSSRARCPARVPPSRRLPYQRQRLCR